MALTAELISRVKRFCLLAEHPKVQRFILGVIVFNALDLGLATSAWLGDRAGWLLSALDICCLGLFVLEIFMKLVVRRFSFFRSGWNIFDFLVVSVSLVPGSGPLTILRALRILRVLRLFARLPRLRLIVESVLQSLPSIGWICALLFMLFYIFAVLTTSLFGKEFSEWFGSIGASMYTLFQVLTLESWSMGIVRPVMKDFPHAYLLFIPFILATSFIVMNVFVGIIVGAMSEVAAAEKNRETEALSGGGPENKKTLEKELALLKEQIAKVEVLLARPDKPGGS